MSHVTPAGVAPHAPAPAPTHVDLVVVGAGPTGLYAAYYAGFRGLSVAVVDSLPELGGQVTALYPEKKIFDVAGFPVVKGRELVEGLVQQAAAGDPTYLLGRTAVSLTPLTDEAGEPTGLEVGLGAPEGATEAGGAGAWDDVLTCGAVLVTAGIGTFAARPLPAAAAWHGDGVEFFVPDTAPYAGADVLVVGGGDSAFDWALHLHEVARSVTLVHRRARFRAHQATIDAVRAAGTRVVAPGEVTRLVDAAGGDGSTGERLVAAEVETDDGTETVRAQRVVAALGFVADLSALKQWGLELATRHVVVDTTMATNLPRVYAAGDITDYPGKVRLISVGFGEAATAVNNIAVALHPESSLFPGHSSDA